MEHYFECALQAAHSGAKGGSIQCAALFAHFADELGLKGGIIYVQNLTKGIAKEAWRDPSQDWLPGDPYRLPCELASDPGVKLCTIADARMFLYSGLRCRHCRYAWSAAQLCTPSVLLHSAPASPLTTVGGLLQAELYALPPLDADQTAEQ